MSAAASTPRLPAARVVPSSPHTSKLLTPEQLADRWGVKTSHVYRLTREGTLPVVKLGRYYRYRVDAIEAWEQEGGSGL